MASLLSTMLWCFVGCICIVLDLLYHLVLGSAPAEESKAPEVSTSHAEIPPYYTSNKTCVKMLYIISRCSSYLSAAMGKHCL